MKININTNKGRIELRFHKCIPVLPYNDLINLYPSSPYEGRRRIVGDKNKTLSSCHFQAVILAVACFIFLIISMSAAKW